MTSRTSIAHTVSTTQPISGAIGDEWYNPTTNKLFKNISYNATSPQWIELFSTTATTSTASFGNLNVSGQLNVGAGGSLNVSNFIQTINLSMPGSVSGPLVGSARFYPSRTVTLTAVNANLGSAPSGNFVFQILKNSLSIGYNFTITAQNPLMSVIYLPSITLTVNDFLTINILNGSAAGTDFAVKISYI